MRFLITGGAGFIGSHLSEALLQQGHHVTVLDDLSTGRFRNIEHLAGHPLFHFAIDTITNENLLDRYVSECDTIFHLAAAVGVELIVRDPVHVIETNILSTHTVLTVAARYRKKVIIASTSEVYGKSQRVPFSEDDDLVLGSTTKSRWSYATSKAVDEFLGLAYHRQKELPVIIVRLFNTVGPRQTGQYGMVIPRFVERALTGEPLQVYGDGTQSRCFCDVTDVCRALVALAKEPSAVGQIFNIGSNEEVTILELARTVLTLVDERLGRTGKGGTLDGRIVFVPYDEAYEHGFEDMHRRVPAIEKIRATIGWTPQTSLRQILERVIGSYAGPEAAAPTSGATADAARVASPPRRGAPGNSSLAAAAPS